MTEMMFKLSENAYNKKELKINVTTNPGFWASNKLIKHFCGREISCPLSPFFLFTEQSDLYKFEHCLICPNRKGVRVSLFNQTLLNVEQSCSIDLQSNSTNLVPELEF